MITPAALVIAPDERLEMRCREINNIDQNLIELMKKAEATMRLKHGIGIAAPQIGEIVRFFVINISEDYHLDTEVKGDGLRHTGGQSIYFLNPEITCFSKDCSLMREGCLSIPRQFYEVERPNQVSIKYIDYVQGKEVELQTNGWLARCIQHELDHLNGKLFIDYLSPLKRELALKKAVKNKRKLSLGE